MPSEEIPKYHTGMEAKYPKERHQDIHMGLLGLRRERSKKTKGITARRYTSKLGFPFPCDNGLMVFEIIERMEAMDRGFKISTASIHFSPKAILITPSLQKNIGAKKSKPTKREALI